eukprot:XP_025002467.1 transmembrane protein 255B isoform X3 [Gallus gallus]
MGRARPAARTPRPAAAAARRGAEPPAEDDGAGDRPRGGGPAGPAGPHRAICKKEEDFTLVHSLSTGRVHFHTDHRSGSYNKNRKCYCGRLLPRHHSWLWIFPRDCWHPPGREQKTNGLTHLWYHVTQHGARSDSGKKLPCLLLSLAEGNAKFITKEERVGKRDFDFHLESFLGNYNGFSLHLEAFIVQIQLVASIVFISFGVVAAFCCAIVDGVFAARHIEPRPLYNRRCQFYSSGVGFLYDAYQTEVTCYTLNTKCQLKVKSNTCYCCDLYNCENSEQSSSYYEFLGVSSCQDVVHLYRLLWSSTVLNIIGLFLGIITAAILGAFKDMVPMSHIAFSSAPPPQILYNPAQQILTYAGFCPSAATISAYPSYPLPLQLKSCAVRQSSVST